MVRKALNEWRKRRSEAIRREQERRRQEVAQRRAIDLPIGSDAAFRMMREIFGPQDDRLQVALALSEAGRHDESIEALSLVIADKPDDPSAYFHRGKSHRECGRTDAALEDFDRAITLDRRPFYLRERSSLLASCGRHEEALADATEALRLVRDKPMRVPYQYDRALRLFTLGRNDEAIADCTEALSLGRPLLAASLHFLRARAYHRTGRHRKAIEDCTRALELRPGYPQVQAVRGLSHTALEHWDEALEDLNAALGLERNTQVLWHRGWCYERTGQLEAAITDYTEVLARHPEHESALTARAMCLSLLRRFAEALTDLEALVRINPLNHEHWLAAATCLGLVGRWEAALGPATRAVELAPLVKENRLARAGILRELGRMPEAAAEERAADELD